VRVKVASVGWKVAAVRVKVASVRRRVVTVTGNLALKPKKKRKDHAGSFRFALFSCRSVAFFEFRKIIGELPQLDGKLLQ